MMSSSCSKVFSSFIFRPQFSSEDNIYIWRCSWCLNPSWDVVDNLLIRPLCRDTNKCFALAQDDSSSTCLRWLCNHVLWMIEIQYTPDGWNQTRSFPLAMTPGSYILQPPAPLKAHLLFALRSSTLHSFGSSLLKHLTCSDTSDTPGVYYEIQYDTSFVRHQAIDCCCTFTVVLLSCLHVIDLKLWSAVYSVKSQEYP